MSTNDELKHEQRLIDAGRAQLFKQQTEAEQKNYTSKTRHGRHVIQMYIEQVSSALAYVTQESVLKSTGRRNLLMTCKLMQELIEFLGSERIAFATLVALVNSYSRSEPDLSAVKLASAVGRSIEDECRNEFYQSILPERDAKLVKKRASMPGSNARYRRYGAQRIAEKVVGKQFDEWHSEHRVRIGLYLLEVCGQTGILKFETVKKKSSQSKIVDLSSFFGEIQGVEQYFLSHAFKSHPLIEIPLDWQLINDVSRRNSTGGYHLPQLRVKQYLCRDYDSSTEFGEKALSLLNVLQKTGWRIDLKVLEVAQYCLENHISVGSKFIVAPFDRPLKGNAPSHVVDDPVLMRQWKDQQSQKHKIFTELQAKGRRTRTVIELARQYKHKTFFLSWSCDWRGRMYPQQPWLHSQGSDYERALLKFRDGCKLNKDGLYWVKAAIGSAYNGSRISHDERIKWTENNQNLIRSIAENPRSSINEWEQAKEPWQFLQLCFEWNEVVIKGVEKFWKVPIGCDSTASGLQLLSAMRRDPVGMKYANLLPPETDSSPPLDAYTRVLEVVKDEIKGDPSRQYLMKYLSYRSIGKPALMVSIYGGSADNIKNSIKDALLKEGISVDNQTASELQKLLLKASKSVFPAAYEALAWLKRLAATAHKSGSTSLTWKLPTGDLINLYKYKLNETKKVYLSDGSSIRVADWEDSEPDLTQQKSSFSPSFVHSYDAALCKEAFSDWSKPLVLIHDCIRVLPNDMDRALDRIRDAFTTLVNGDPLASLATDLGVDSTQLKPLKQLGCDLDQVLQSRYMFN